MITYKHWLFLLVMLASGSLFSQSVRTYLIIEDTTWGHSVKLNLNKKVLIGYTTSKGRQLTRDKIIRLTADSAYLKNGMSIGIKDITYLSFRRNVNPGRVLPVAGYILLCSGYLLALDDAVPLRIHPFNTDNEWTTLLAIPTGALILQSVQLIKQLLAQTPAYDTSKGWNIRPVIINY